MIQRLRNWPWLTLQIIAANVAIIILLATAWYLVFRHQSTVYSDRLMSTFNIEPGRLHAMYVDDVERQLWYSVALGLVLAILASVGLAFLIARPLRSLATATEQLRHGDYQVRSTIEKGEVGQLARNFNALAATLEQEEDRRTRFMIDLGHELRTPIMSLRGYTEGLEDGVFEADDSYFKLISSELSHMTALTHTIETMQLGHESKEETQLESRVTVAKLLEDSKDQWRVRFEQRDLELSLAIPENLRDSRFAATVRSLKQILDNLLSNMIRYAAVDSPCQINVCKGEKADTINLIFINETLDVSESSLPYLFDRLYRVSESRTRMNHERPSGLGLSVVKQLCLSNRGNVTATLASNTLCINVNLPLIK